MMPDAPRAGRETADRMLFWRCSAITQRASMVPSASG
jgi:hypothetical protein